MQWSTNAEVTHLTLCFVYCRVMSQLFYHEMLCCWCNYCIFACSYCSKRRSVTFLTASGDLRWCLLSCHAPVIQKVNSPKRADALKKINRKIYSGPLEKKRGNVEKRCRTLIPVLIRTEIKAIVAIFWSWWITENWKCFCMMSMFCGHQVIERKIAHCH